MPVNRNFSSFLRLFLRDGSRTGSTSGRGAACRPVCTSAAPRRPAPTAGHTCHGPFTIITSQTNWGEREGRDLSERWDCKSLDTTLHRSAKDAKRNGAYLARSTEAADVRVVSRRPAAPPVSENLRCWKIQNKRFFCLLPNLARTGLKLWCWGRGCILALGSVPPSDLRGGNIESRGEGECRTA